MSQKVIHLADFHPFSDGINNDFTALSKCFSKAGCDGNIIVIEPGRYLVDSEVPIELNSGTTVIAANAEFIFPRSLGGALHRSMFRGVNISDFYWFGGSFRGYVYNPINSVGLWEPSACSKGIELLRTPEGRSENIRFENVRGIDVGGSVISVYGTFDENSNRRYPVKNVDIKSCCFENSGKFMWDYGYLWQRIVFPEHHSSKEISDAYKYMPSALISGRVEFSAEGAEICVENMPKAIENESDTVCFFGDVPPELLKGCCYYIRTCKKLNGFTYLTVSATPGGEVISRFTRPGGSCRLFRNLFTVHHNLYAPDGSGTGKGPLDLSVCDAVKVSDCRMSASGDSMHIHRSHNVVFTGNQITGSRMGAFFIAQFCKNVTVSANTVLGTNGSRVMSVEKSTEDITIIGNTFMGGGRGTWINQPYNIIISDNIFSENTNKCTPSPYIGRLTPNSGKYECYPEIYFTTWEKDACYGAVIMRSNIIKTTPYCSAAVAFHDGGRNIVFESNIIQGEKRDIFVGKKCEYPHMTGNIGVGNITDRINEEKFDQ
ncbi:MAG: NosD domain-containing protein [Eubacteriales bacterium]